jgi:hypothetical protein
MRLFARGIVCLTALLLLVLADVGAAKSDHGAEPGTTSTRTARMTLRSEFPKRMLEPLATLAR